MHMVFPTTKNSPEVTHRKYMLTVKVPISTIADDILKSFSLVFKENKQMIHMNSL